MLSTGICAVPISVDKQHRRKALFTAPSTVMEVLAQVWCLDYSMIAYLCAYIEVFLQIWCSKQGASSKRYGACSVAVQIVNCLLFFYAIVQYGHYIYSKCLTRIISVHLEGVAFNDVESDVCTRRNNCEKITTPFMIQTMNAMRLLWAAQTELQINRCCSLFKKVADKYSNGRELLRNTLTLGVDGSGN